MSVSAQSSSVEQRTYCPQCNASALKPFTTPHDGSCSVRKHHLVETVKKIDADIRDLEQRIADLQRSRATAVAEAKALHAHTPRPVQRELLTEIDRAALPHVIRGFEFLNYKIEIVDGSPCKVYRIHA